MSALQLENLSLWFALIGFAVTTTVAVFATILKKSPEKTLLGLITLSWLLHTLAIGLRWERLGHLPFINIFEMLSANIWGLMTAVMIAYLFLPRFRPAVVVIMPVVMLLLAWLLMIPNFESSLPATYHTIWLFIHIAFLKIFLGAAFVALAFAMVILLREYDIGRDRFARMANDKVLDEYAYRCMALALIFDTLGVVAGAIWAQDAWGHYWSWDPLEIWSLITWLAIAITLHVRSSFKSPPLINAWLIVGTFVVAFFNRQSLSSFEDALHG